MPDCEEDHYTSGHFTKLLQISSFFACHGLKMSLFFRKSYRSSTFPPRFLLFSFRPFIYYVRTFLSVFHPTSHLLLRKHLLSTENKKNCRFLIPFPPSSTYVVYEWSLCIAWLEKLYRQKRSYFIILRSLIILHSIFSEECKIL